jgi:mercuric ion transport protein
MLVLDRIDRGERPMVRPLARQALPFVAAAFVGCCLVQVFLAGLGVFDDPASFITHRDFGYLIGWFTLAMLILALVGREPRRIVGLCVLVLVQFALQSVFVALRTDLPTIAALHPLNGMLIVVVGLLIVRLSWAVRGEPDRVGVRAAEAGPVTSTAVGSGTPPEVARW